jgi:hypothetical protein
MRIRKDPEPSVGSDPGGSVLRIENLGKFLFNLMKISPKMFIQRFLALK